MLQEFKGVSILNAAPALKLSNDILRLSSIFCVNELEAEEMTGIEIKNPADVKSSIEALLGKGCQMVIITLGKLGAAFSDEGKIVLIPLPGEYNVIDTVGAGDAFIGALAFFISKFPEATWTQKIGASIEIASHSVERKGTQTSFVSFPAIDPGTKSYKYQELC